MFDLRVGLWYSLTFTVYRSGCGRLVDTAKDASWVRGERGGGVDWRRVCRRGGRQTHRRSHGLRQTERRHDQPA